VVEAEVAVLLLPQQAQQLQLILTTKLMMILQTIAGMYLALELL
jgi:hypothetical protein